MDDDSTGNITYFADFETQNSIKPIVKHDIDLFNENDFARYEKTKVKRKVLGHVFRQD